MSTFSIEAPGRRRRRRHSAEFRASVVMACQQPGVSTAAVALANGLNATLLRRWVVEAERVGPPQPPKLVEARQATAPPGIAPVTGFIPLALPAPAAQADVRIELRRGDTTINVTWPISASADCVAWLREWLR